MKTFISRFFTKATLTLAVPALFLVSLQLHAADRETIAESLQQNAEEPIIVPAQETGSLCRKKCSERFHAGVRVKNLITTAVV